MLTRTAARRRPLGAAVAVAALVSALVLPLVPAADAVAAPVDISSDSVAFRVVDQAGQPVAGARVLLEYSRNGNHWNPEDARAIDDCTSGCAGAGDRDPAPGEFQVAVGDNGNRSYRATVVTAPTGYEPDGGVVTYSGNSFRPAARLGDLVVRRASWTPVPCVGTAFALLQDGSVQQVTTGSPITVSAFGGWSLAGGQANGLAAGGGSLYAVERGSQTVNAILRYSTDTGWQRTPVASPNDTPWLVAGAFDRAGARYIFGGFSGAGSTQVFRLYQYVVSQGVSLLGTIATGAAGDTSAGSGDMAFDGAGNLIIVRAGTSTIISTFRVTPAALAAANGGAIAASVVDATRDVGLSGIAGAAFAADGALLLSDGSTLRSYPASGSASAMLTSALGSMSNPSTDLASCVVPATPQPTASLSVDLQVLGRVVSTDVFQVRARSGQVVLASSSTGSAQRAQIALAPIAPGAYTIDGSVTSGSSSDYASTVACTGATLTSGGTWTGSVEVAAGAAAACTITISPVVTYVTVRKQVIAAGSQIGVPAANWQMTVHAPSATPSTEQAHQTRSDGATQRIALRHTADASVTVRESQQAAYTAQSVSCTVTAPGAGPLTTTQASVTDIQLTRVRPGSIVDCTFVNRERPTTLTLAATMEGGSAAAWRLSAIGPDGALAGPTGTTGSGLRIEAPVSKGIAYRLDAAGDPAYLGTWACVDQQGTTVPVTDSKVTVAQGSQATCTVTLTTARLTLLKHVAGQPSALLASGFTLTATPSTAIAGLPAVTVPGSETVVPSGAGANSFDVRPDHEYRLTEATSYAALGLELQQYRGGYPANGVFLEAEWVTVTSPTARVAVGGHEVYRFVSAAPAPLALPLTGGVGADTYQLGGSGVLLLSFLASAFLLVRTRIRSRTAGRRA